MMPSRRVAARLSSLSAGVLLCSLAVACGVEAGPADPAEGDIALATGAAVVPGQAPPAAPQADPGFEDTDSDAPGTPGCIKKFPTYAAPRCQGAPRIEKVDSCTEILRNGRPIDVVREWIVTNPGVPIAAANTCGDGFESRDVPCIDWCRANMVPKPQPNDTVDAKCVKVNTNDCGDNVAFCRCTLVI